MKKINYFFITLLILIITIPSIVLAEPPEKPPGESGGGPGGNSAASVTHNGVSTFSSDTEESDKSYTSNEVEVNAIYVSGGTCTLNNPTVTKTGSPTSRSDNYDFYGTNAAIFVNNGATLKLKEGDIVSVAVKIKGDTIAGQFKKFLFRITGDNSAVIVGEESGIVTTTAK